MRFTRSETAAYLSDQCEEMRKLAAEAKLEALAHILAMGALEAHSLLRQLGRPARKVA